MEKNYTVDWFSSNVPNWEPHIKHLYGKEGVKVLEIGSFEGRSSCWILDTVVTGKGSELTCVDTWEGSMENTSFHKSTIWDTFNKNISGYPSDKIRILRGKSGDVLRTFSNVSYDLIYVDGSHQAKNVLEDAILAFHWLKKDGIIIFDDYLWAMYNQPYLCPKPAVDAFAYCYQRDLQLLHIDYQVIFKKTNEN